jgi:hypothetical protein
MASMRELAMELLSRSGTGPVLQPTNVYGQDPDLPIGYGEGDVMSPIDAAAMSTMFVPGVGDVTGLAADVDMYMRDPESRNIPNYLLTAAGALPFLPAASQVRQGIKAYHGSPHDFPPVRELEMPDGAVVYQSMGDAVPEGARVIAEHPLGRFDMSKLGTGEGAQAYGQGLYFAESEDVAKGYRDALASRKPSPTHKGRGYDELEGPEYRALSAIEREVRYNKKLSPKEAKELAITSLKQQKKRAAENIDPAIREERLKDYDEDLAALESMSPDDIVIGGSMYEVNIDADPDELLDWDQLIDEQPSKVLDKLKKSDWWEYAEEGIYDRAGARGDNPTGADLIRWLEEDGGEYAAEALKDLGVKGVRYADAFTRHKTPDKRSMNYVIFDDRLITIAKKYGIAIPAAAAMLARMTGEDTSQSYQEET